VESSVGFFVASAVEAEWRRTKGFVGNCEGFSLQQHNPLGYTSGFVWGLRTAQAGRKQV
jgi:hypothetical protein